MYDVGLSALVLKICSDYSQSLGLNFPPNVQQEINAIAQWVDTHTVKDISFTQDGNVVTITATTQNNSSQSWVFTLPDISVDKLYSMIKGSNGVNVDYSEDRNTLVISLDKSQEIQSVKLTFPKGATSGTITQDQLTILQLNKSNYIEMINDNELYYLNDNGHTDGYLTYSHVGIENGKATIKTLTITVSAKSFVTVTTVVPTESEVNVYMHSMEFKPDSSAVSAYFLYFYSTFNTSITLDNILEYSLRIPFGSLNHIDNNGVLISDGVITSIESGPPGKFILTKPGAGKQFILELSVDRVTKV